MAERSRFWNSPSLGDSSEAPYDADTEFAQVLSSMLNLDRLASVSGVLLANLDEYEPTVTAGNVAVGTGRAFVYGSWHQNDAAVNFPITTPTVATRRDRFVLRKSWASQTVRITRIVGTEGGGVPSPVNTIGLTWDFPLFTITVTTAGVITVDVLQGRLLYPVPNVPIPRAQVYRTTAQSIPNGGAIVTWTSGGNVIDDFWSPAAPTRFTIYRDGLYEVEVFLYFAAYGVNHQIGAGIRVNGVIPAWSVDQVDAWQGTSLGTQRLSLKTDIQLNRGDYIEIWASQNSGAPNDLLPIVDAYLPFPRSRISFKAAAGTV